MPQKKEYDEQLSGWVASEVLIECTKCKNIDGSISMDETEGEEHFWEKGWRAKDDDCYCPKCAKKYKIK